MDISDFKVIGYDKFSVTYLGVESHYSDGAPSIGKDFSGTVHYSASYELPKAPEKGERYRIVLEDCAVSATVLIDGVRVGDVGMLPMLTEVDGGLLSGSGEISILLSNTAANEIVAKRELIFKTFPIAEIGTYDAVYTDKMPEFEKRQPELKFGKVRIERLK